MSQSTEIFKHFLWATKHLTNVLETMSNEVFNQKINDKARSIKEIVLHLISTYAYFSSQSEYREIMDKSKKIEKNELINLMKELSKKVYDIFESNPNKIIPVKTKNGTINEIKGFNLFYMVTDHFAYHRGQIMIIFKELTGKDGVGTDYALYVMEDDPDIVF